MYNLLILENKVNNFLLIFLLFILQDLQDGGSKHIAECIGEIKKQNPNILVECLAPDFRGDLECITHVALSGLDVYAHNIETVERLTPFVRDRRANYKQSLKVLAAVKQINPNLFTKSSIMLGLGESDEEVLQTLNGMDLHITFYF